MAKKSRRRERFSLGRAMGLGAQAAGEALYGQPVLHINCRGSMQIDNCRGVLLYDDHQLRLDMGGREVLIEGAELVIGTYQKRLITVRGNIFSIRFYNGGGTQVAQQTSPAVPGRHGSV